MRQIGGGARERGREGAGAAAVGERPLMIRPGSGCSGAAVLQKFRVV